MRKLVSRYFGSTQGESFRGRDMVLVDNDALCRMEEVWDDYTELLISMASRDPNLDPIWMEQYAKAQLAELEKHRDD